MLGVPVADIEAKVTSRERIYKINELGLAAVAKFLEPQNAFAVNDLGANDRVTLTVTITISGDPANDGSAVIHLDLPAGMLEEIL